MRKKTKAKKAKRKGRLMWGLLYTGTFFAAFLTSALIKMKADPFHGKYTIRDWNDSIGTIHTDLSYGDGDANKFDLYLPADNTKESYGLIVYLHAGGFTSGDKSGDEGVYSQSMDIKNAMPVVVSEAEKLGYHLDRMAISGGSAGGCLALIYAYRDADTAPVPLKMVFEMVGPASFYYEDWTNYGLDKSTEAAANLFSVMSGTAITKEQIESGEYLDIVKPISADRFVKPGSAPALIAYGTHDKVCPFKSVQHLIDAFEANQVTYDYYEFPHSGHGLQNDNAIYQQYMEKLEEYLTNYME